MALSEKKDKLEVIRKMLLKAVEKDPDLFSYYASIQEAKEMLGITWWQTSFKFNDLKPSKKITDI